MVQGHDSQITHWLVRRLNFDGETYFFHESDWHLGQHTMFTN